MENPYSMSECEKMLDEGTWPGGFVKDDAGQVSYVMKSVTVQGYSGSGSGSDWQGSDYEFCTGSYDWHGSDTDENGSDNGGKAPVTGNEGGTGTGTGGNTGGGTGGGGWNGNSNYNNNFEPDDGDGDEKDIHYYTYEEVEKMMDDGTWMGGYIKDVGYIPADCIEIKPLTYASSGEAFLQRARKYDGVPYKYGGEGMKGIDCSGLVSAALGLTVKWSTLSGPIPGMRKVPYSKVEDLRNGLVLQKGDVLVWKWKNSGGKECGHAAIYVEGTKLFHAHGKRVSETSDMNAYWLSESTRKWMGIPVVYRLP